MRALMIVKAHEPRECGRACRRVGIGSAIGPLAQQRLNKAFGFAVGPRRVRPGEPVLELPAAARVRKAARAIAITVVGQETPDPDAATGKPLDRPVEKSGARVLALRALDLDIGQARRVIDGDVGVFPAATARVWVDGAAPKAVPDGADSPERLDVQVEQITGVRPLIALHQRPRFEQGQAIQAEAREDAGDGRAGHMELLTNLPAGGSGLPKRADRPHVVRGCLPR